MESNNETRQLSVVIALLKRDFAVLKKRLFDGALNNLVIFTCILIVFGIFGPLINIAPARLPVVLIGTLVWNVVYSGYLQSLRDVYDIQTNRHILYTVTLPLSLNWLALRWIIRYIAEIILIVLPAILLFIIVSKTPLLLTAKPLLAVRPLLLIIIFALSLLFVALKFLIIIFCTSFMWFKNNLWVRLLLPMNALGCIFYPWKAIYHANPFFSYVMLLNPLTYITEGFRAAILAPNISISVAVCITVLLLINGIGLIIVRPLAQKRLEGL